MIINPVNNINQNNPRKNLKINPNFTSVIPAKIFKDGELVTNVKDIRRSIRAFFKDLMSDNIKNQKSQRIRSGFQKFDKELDLSLDKGQVIRDYVGKYLNNGIIYFFTGGHAQRLDESGRQVGLVKAGYSRMEETDACRSYFDKIKEFISKHNGSKLGVVYDPLTHVYYGEKLGLHLCVKEVPTKRGSKIVVDNIKFRRIQN